MKYIAIPETRSSITLTFKRANPKSDYIRILQCCDGNPKTLHEIYPWCKNPIADAVVSLAKHGYLQKYTEEKHIHISERHYGITKKHVHYTKVWYKTTRTGRVFAKKILSK